LGYDEYLAKLEAAKPDEDNITARAPTDDFEGKKEAVVFTKKVEEDDLDSYLIGGKTKPNKGKSKSKNKKQVLGFDEFAAASSNKGRNDRGGKGGKGRGKGRGGRQGAFRMDESNFPKLG
jgi:hypothetical protein